MKSAISVKGEIGLMDPHNPYGLKDKKDFPDLKKTSIVSASTADTSFRNMSLDLSYIDDENGPMRYVIASKSYDQEMVHKEIMENKDNFVFDDANDKLEELCTRPRIDLKEITSIKFHTNSWGLSSCNWMAENIICKMTSLTRIDFSETINFQPRSDIGYSTNSMLVSAQKFKIEKIYLQDNFLDEDGVKCLSDFMEVNTTLKELNLTNCGLSDKSGAILLKTVTKIKLTHLKIGQNEFKSKGMADLGKFLVKMGSVEHFDVSKNNHKVLKPDDNLKSLLTELKQLKTLRTLNLSGVRSQPTYVPVLASLIQDCKTLESLDISDLSLEKAAQQTLYDGILSKCRKDWGLYNNLSCLYWQDCIFS